MQKHSITESELYDLIDFAREALIIRDWHAHVVYWNKGAEELYGWSKEEALGEVTHVLLKTKFPISLAAIEQMVAQEGVWEGELIHQRKDGKRLIVSSRWSRHEKRSHVFDILEINTDITALKQQMKSLEEVNLIMRENEKEIIRLKAQLARQV